jgi:alpha-beta hydrolase superfamily lysophospholipase
MLRRLQILAGVLVLLTPASGAPAANSAVLQTQTEQQQVTFESHAVTLAGDIVFPKSVRPAAALVIVAGSGKTERMLTVAGLLAQNGFVVLTYDKRGVGKSGGVYWGATQRTRTSRQQLSIFW